jgi:hypothetical protein
MALALCATLALVAEALARVSLGRAAAYRSAAQEQYAAVAGRSAAARLTSCLNGATPVVGTSPCPGTGWSKWESRRLGFGRKLPPSTTARVQSGPYQVDLTARWQAGAITVTAVAK